MIISVPLFIKANQFNQTAVPVTAVIQTIERYRDYDRIDNKTEIRHNVYVSYTYEGESYDDVPLGYYHSSMREGDVIDIKIDPDQPTRLISSVLITTNFRR